MSEPTPTVEVTFTIESRNLVRRLIRALSAASMEGVISMLRDFVFGTGRVLEFSTGDSEVRLKPYAELAFLDLIEIALTRERLHDKTSRAIETLQLAGLIEGDPYV